MHFSEQCVCHEGMEGGPQGQQRGALVVGCKLDQIEKPVGLELDQVLSTLDLDGIVKLFNLEEGGVFTVNRTPNILLYWIVFTLQ